MDTRQALEKVYEYFVDETHAPGFRNDACVYYANGSDAVRCGVGCLIPEEFQERAGKVVGEVGVLFMQIPKLKEYFRDVDLKVLRSIQHAHDIWARSLEFGSSREDFLMHVQMLMRYYEEEG